MGRRSPGTTKIEISSASKSAKVSWSSMPITLFSRAAIIVAAFIGCELGGSSASSCFIPQLPQSRLEMKVQGGIGQTGKMTIVSFTGRSTAEIVRESLQLRRGVTDIAQPATVMRVATNTASEEPLSDKEKSTTELVQETWRLAEADLDAHGVKFFMRIFEIAPPALNLFRFKNDTPLEESPGMKEHANEVMRTVGLAVAGLTDVSTIIPVLDALGSRHADYGVLPVHFEVVGEALLWTLEQGLGELWTEEVAEAWTGTYATVQSVMEPALVRGIAAAEAKKTNT